MRVAYNRCRPANLVSMARGVSLHAEGTGARIGAHFGKLGIEPVPENAAGRMAGDVGLPVGAGVDLL